jgi:hypothetical protein
MEPQDDAGTLMLVDETGGPELAEVNGFGAEDDIDVLWDVPEVISVVRVRFPNGARYEAAMCPKNVDQDDIETARTLIPDGALRIKAPRTDVLGCGHADEYCFAFWVV